MKNLSLFSIFFSLSFLMLAQTGKVFDNLSMKSELLKMERKYAIYLPPDYETSERDYPVLYLLHGAGDDQTGWVQFGEILHIADKAILEGNATSMIVVMPDANTGQRGYFNNIKGDWRYEDFFFQEFMPFVEKTYRYARQAAQPVISNSSLKDVVLFFPKSKTEQQTIVRQLDALRAETQKLEAVYQKKIADLEELKKSILQKAFAGELRGGEPIESKTEKTVVL